MYVNGDLPVIHGFEQSGLRLGRRAVDLVGKQDIGEDRATLEFELLLDGGVDGNAKDIGGKHVAGELDSLKAAIQGTREGLAQRGFANSRDAFDEQVSAREDGDQGEPDNVVFAAYDLAQRDFQLACAVSSGGGGFRRHAKNDFTMRGRGKSVTNVRF